MSEQPTTYFRVGNMTSSQSGIQMQTDLILWTRRQRDNAKLFAAQCERKALAREYLAQAGAFDMVLKLLESIQIAE